MTLSNGFDILGEVDCMRLDVRQTIMSYFFDHFSNLLPFHCIIFTYLLIQNSIFINLYNLFIVKLGRYLHYDKIYFYLN